MQLHCGGRSKQAVVHSHDELPDTYADACASAPALRSQPYVLVLFIEAQKDTPSVYCLAAWSSIRVSTTNSSTAPAESSDSAPAPPVPQTKLHHSNLTNADALRQHAQLNSFVTVAPCIADIAKFRERGVQQRARPFDPGIVEDAQYPKSSRHATQQQDSKRKYRTCNGQIGRLSQGIICAK